MTDQQPAEGRDIDPNDVWEAYLADLNGGTASPQGAVAFAVDFVRHQPQSVAAPARSAGGINGCLKTTKAALRYLAENNRPSGGQSQFNAEHLLQIADEVDRTTAVISKVLTTASDCIADLGSGKGGWAWEEVLQEIGDLQDADAILALTLPADEAAIRADERERCAKVAENVERGCDVGFMCANAIRHPD